MPLTSGGLTTGRLTTGKINETRKADKAKKKRSQAEKKAADKKRAQDARDRDKADRQRRRDKDKNLLEQKKEDEEARAKKDEEEQDENRPANEQQPKEIEGVPGQVVGRIDKSKLDHLKSAIAKNIAVNEFKALLVDFLTTGIVKGPVATAAEKLRALGTGEGEEDPGDPELIALANTLDAFCDGWGEAYDSWNEQLGELAAANGLTVVFAESKNAEEWK